MTKKPLPKRLREWSETPSVNPRYKGATPADMARALLDKKPVKKTPNPQEKADEPRHPAR